MFNFFRHGRQPLSQQVRKFSSSQSVKVLTDKVKETDHLVFVYGTFKQGGVNSHVFDKAASRAVARTCDRYPLVLDEGLPFLLDFKGYGSQVNGSLFRVGASTLKALERELDAISPAYTRFVIPVEVTDGGALSTQARAITYVRRHFPLELLSLQWNSEYHNPVPTTEKAQPWFNGPNGILSALCSSPSAKNSSIFQFSQNFYMANAEVKMA
jgi:gamma-glutamylcyclotransferase (GGCT)/AIG2-like uncharacterized protein YtfP